MATATFIKKLPNFRGDARLYELAAAAIAKAEGKGG